MTHHIFLLAKAPWRSKPFIKHYVGSKDKPTQRQLNAALLSESAGQVYTEAIGVHENDTHWDAKTQTRKLLPRYTATNSRTSAEIVRADFDQLD